MPGNFDDFIIRADCPGCGTEVAAAYGGLRHDPRVTCRCGLAFAIYLEGCPVAEADRLWDYRRTKVANDNGDAPYLVKS